MNDITYFDYSYKFSKRRLSNEMIASWRNLNINDNENIIKSTNQFLMDELTAYEVRKTQSFAFKKYVATNCLFLKKSSTYEVVQKKLYQSLIESGKSKKDSFNEMINILFSIAILSLNNEDTRLNKFKKILPEDIKKYRDSNKNHCDWITSLSRENIEKYYIKSVIKQLIDYFEKIDNSGLFIVHTKYNHSDVYKRIIEKHKNDIEPYRSISIYNDLTDPENFKETEPSYQHNKGKGSANNFVIATDLLYRSYMQKANISSFDIQQWREDSSIDDSQLKRVSACALRDEITRVLIKEYRMKIADKFTMDKIAILKELLNPVYNDIVLSQVAKETQFEDASYKALLIVSDLYNIMMNEDEYKVHPKQNRIDFIKDEIKEIDIIAYRIDNPDHAKNIIMMTRLELEQKCAENRIKALRQINNLPGTKRFIDVMKKKHSKAFSEITDKNKYSIEPMRTRNVIRDLRKIENGR